MVMASNVRKPWLPFLAKAMVLSCSIIAFILWFKENYVLGDDTQLVKCIPGIDWYLGDRHDREIVRDAIYRVSSRGLEPIYDDGTVLVKYLRGVPGDHILINENGIFINNEKVASGNLPLAGKFNKQRSDFYGERILQEDEYWLMGTSEVSFDSRYWGTVSYEQILSRAYPLF